jgi:RNA polymerase sigma-70 factor (sigma-E family)
MRRTEVRPVDETAAAASPLAALGDRAGYDRVFLEHWHDLLGLAWVLCGDRDRAEEAAAEAFASVYPHWRQGRVRDERAYLRRAVVNDLRGRARRRATADRHDARLAPPDAVADQADATLARGELVAALLRLPARQRAVIAVRFYLDLSEADTAALLGMRPGTVKSQTSRGLQRLRQLLEEE